MVRLTENNDWVIFIILAAILIFVVVLQYLQRESGLKNFFTQNFIDSGNIFPTWLIVSIVYVVLLSVLISQFIPVIPKKVEAISLFGYSLNKFGFTFGAVSLFYFIKFFLTFFLYSSVGQDKKWGRLYFVSSKFYFAMSILLIFAIIARFYFPVNELIFFRIFIISAISLFVFKNIFYFFNKNYILPNEWHYKILYICTLQFAAVLALCKLLFL